MRDKARGRVRVHAKVKRYARREGISGEKAIDCTPGAGRNCPKLVALKRSLSAPRRKLSSARSLVYVLSKSRFFSEFGLSEYVARSICNEKGSYLKVRCSHVPAEYICTCRRKRIPNTVVDVLSVMENQADVKVRRADDSGERECD